MKAIFILCGIILLAGGGWVYRFTQMPNQYGTFTGAPKAEVADLIQNPKGFMKKTVALEGVVFEQCEAAGCYFYFHHGDQSLRIDLQDILTTAPQKTGRTARVEGRIVKYGDGYQLAASAIEFK